MTVIAGFPYGGGAGILLCSDSEHSGGEEKFYRAKIINIESPIGSAGFAYTGNMASARAAINKCVRAVKHPQNANTAILDVVSETLEREYTEKVLNIQSRADHPDYWYGICIALWSQDAGLGLFFADGLSLEPRERPVYSGSGGTIAECSMRSLYWLGIELWQLLLSTTYMLRKAKECSAGVGGQSKFLVLRNDGTFAGADWLFPERYEKALKEFDSTCGALLFSVMDRDLATDEFERRLAGIQDSMRRMRTECRGNATEELIERLLRRSGL